MSEQPHDESTVHIHIWNKKGGHRVLDVDAKWTGTYDDYYQFGVELPDGTWLELRVWKEEFVPTGNMMNFP